MQECFEPANLFGSKPSTLSHLYPSCVDLQQPCWGFIFVIIAGTSTAIIILLAVVRLASPHRRLGCITLPNIAAIIVIAVIVNVTSY